MIRKDGVKMTAHEIWVEFLGKLQNDAFAEDDFRSDMRSFLFLFLAGEPGKSRREKFADSPHKAFDGETKKCVVVNCPDGDYRFDFQKAEGKWQLCFIEGITLPVNNIESTPYDFFTPLPEQEAWIKTEREISKIIHFYCKLKDVFGIDKALSWFKDGAGEFLCAKSWVPFYGDSKAFIAFSAWIENRINGECVSIDEFTDSRCQLRFTRHLWFKVYHTASHIKPQISLEEYGRLFEYIWQDRAHNAGWRLTFRYINEDTVLIFSKDID